MFSEFLFENTSVAWRSWAAGGRARTCPALPRIARGWGIRSVRARNSRRARAAVVVILDPAGA